jgi:hypothetical protein
MNDDIERRLASQVDRATPDAPPPFATVTARRDRRRTRRRAGFAVVGSAAAIAAILAGTTMLRADGTTDPDPAPPFATETSTDPTATQTPAPPMEAPSWDGKGVPPLSLLLGDEVVVLAPWTSCYANGCRDGLRPEHLDDVGSPESMAFSFPVPGWKFEATFRDPGDDCGRSITVPATSTGERTFTVDPAGPPRTYAVDLFGRGPGGDVIYSFRWTTPAAGTLPEPDGYLGLLSTSGGERHVYSPELSLNDLARTPENATAVITVTAADGATRTLPTLRPERGCYGEGHVFFQGSDGLVDALGLVDLGPLPYTYSVRIVLDGTTYTGTAVYPDDEIKGQEPYAALTFEPPLPAYAG